MTQRFIVSTDDKRHGPLHLTISNMALEAPAPVHAIHSTLASLEQVLTKPSAAKPKPAKVTKLGPGYKGAITRSKAVSMSGSRPPLSIKEPLPGDEQYVDVLFELFASVWFEGALMEERE